MLRLIPVEGVAISTLGNVLGSETVSASDPRAQCIDEFQFDLGEGPCWDALSSNSPVLMNDAAARARATWPLFGEAIAAEGIGALFAFPLAIGPLRFGAIDLYSMAAQSLTGRQVGDVQIVAEHLSRAVLRRALQPILDDDNGPYSRRTLHQATGMVLVQLDIPAEDARLVIQAHAFASSRSVRETAQDVLDGRLRFHTDDDGIHGHADE